MGLARCIVVACACLSALSPLRPAAAAHGPDIPRMERRLLEHLNAGRSDPSANPDGRPEALVAHAGLTARAREHAARMRSEDRLSHDGLDARVGSAAPDPAERNAAPDDGFVAAYCENVGFYSTSAGTSDEQVVRALYEAFYGSPKHRACMLDEHGSGYTVAGVGFVERDDGEGRYTMWVSIMVVRDTTLPGGGRAAPLATPVPEPTPPPRVTPAPSSSPVRPVARPVERPVATPAATPVVTPAPTPVPPEPLPCVVPGRGTCLVDRVGPSALEQALA